MKTVELTLPWPPSVNSYKRPGRISRTKLGKIYQQRVDTPDTKLFYWKVAMKIRAMMTHEGLKSFSGDTILSLGIEAYPPDAKRRDIDNICKVLIDSLQKGKLFPDDYQIARLLVVRKSIVAEGKVIVRVSEIE